MEAAPAVVVGTGGEGTRRGVGDGNVAEDAVGENGGSGSRSLSGRILAESSGGLDLAPLMAKSGPVEIRSLIPKLGPPPETRGH